MESLEERAVQAHQSGLNCAQAVVTSYSDKLSFDTNLALSLACGFGGGMGRLQETCGAVTGGFMVLGIYNCKKYTENKERKEKTYAMVQQFSKKFKTIHGTTDCKTLLNCDLKTEEGQKYFQDHNLSALVCNKCIADSVRTIEELIK